MADHSADSDLTSAPAAPSGRVAPYHRRLVQSANFLLRRTGMAIVPAGRLGSLQRLPRFTLRHHGTTVSAIGQLWLPSLRMTERSLEMAVADRWLKRIGHDRVVETGAVTPYDWPGRIAMVVDPYDPHPLVTHRTSLFGTDLSGLDVLRDLDAGTHRRGGLRPGRGEETAVHALRRSRYPGEIPYGFNPAVDATLFSNYRFPADVTALCMVRSEQGNDWRESPVRAAANPDGAC